MSQFEIAAADSAAGQAALAGGSRPVRANKRTGEVLIRAPRGVMVNSVLRKDEWEELDREVVKAALYPLRGVADLRAKGLIKRLGGLGTLISQWNTQSEVTGATISMSPRAKGESDRPDYKLASVPIPVIFKEFDVDARELDASRRLGNGLDVTAGAACGRVVAEGLEGMLFNGAGTILNGATLYGYRTHPGRNTDTATNYGGGDWTSSIDNIVPTVAGMIAAANADRHYGPFTLYVSTVQYNEAALSYYSDGSGDTPLKRILEMPQIAGVQQLDANILPAGELVLVQLTPDVVDWAEALDITTLEWMSGDGMVHHFKVIAVAAPRIKADYEGRSGVVHATGA